MKITNKLNLPHAVVEAVTNDPYTNGGADYSITTLIKPPRIVALERTHAEELTEDASERIYSLYGQIVHGILERGKKEGVDSEIRLFGTFNGVKVSGQIDQHERGVIRDFKFTTSYKFKNGHPIEFEQQLNCYAELARENGMPVERLELVGLLRDWSKLEAKRESSYPQTQIVIVEVPLWNSALEFILDRIDQHEAAKTTLPFCTDEEIWKRNSTWAVMLPGKKRALKLHDTKAAAEYHAKELLGAKVEERPAEAIRCMYYCPVSDFCTQFKGEENGVQSQTKSAI